MASKELINQDRLIILFTWFALASASLLINYVVRFPSTNIYSVIKLILFYFGFFGYIAVIGILLFNYASKTFKWFKKDNMRTVILTVILLGFGYSLFDGLKESSWYAFFRDICLAGLTVVGLPFMGKFITKLKNGKKKK